MPVTNYMLFCVHSPASGNIPLIACHNPGSECNGSPSTCYNQTSVPSSALTTHHIPASEMNTTVNAYQNPQYYTRCLPYPSFCIKYPIQIYTVYPILDSLPTKIPELFPILYPPPIKIQVLYPMLDIPPPHPSFCNQYYIHHLSKSSFSTQY